MPRLFVLVAALALAGCGDDTTSINTMNDLAATADMSVPADLTALACSGILACDAGCGQNFVCQAACRNAGTTNAKGLFDAFAGCVALSCASGDGGSGACTSATDTSTKCETCLADVATQAPSTSAACHAEYVSCATS